MAISVVSFSFSRAAQPEARGSSFLLSADFLNHILSPTGLVSKLTDFLSSPSYIIVQSPTQYLPITGHRDVSLPLSLEWHVWLSSSGNNCHAVHRSLSSGASVYDCTAGFYLVPYCQSDSPTPMEYALPPSLEWHVWRGRKSIYYTEKPKRKPAVSLYCHKFFSGTISVSLRETYRMATASLLSNFVQTCDQINKISQVGICFCFLICSKDLSFSG